MVHNLNIVVSVIIVLEFGKFRLLVGFDLEARMNRDTYFITEEFIVL